MIQQFGWLQAQVDGYGGVDFAAGFPDVPDATASPSDAVQIKLADLGSIEKSRRATEELYSEQAESATASCEKVVSDTSDNVMTVVDKWDLGSKTLEVIETAHQYASTAKTLTDPRTNPTKIFDQTYRMTPSEMLMVEENEMLLNLPPAEGELWALSHGVARYVRYTFAHPESTATYVDLAVVPTGGSAPLKFVGALRAPVDCRGQVVKLQRLSGSGWVNSAETTTDILGQFSFSVPRVAVPCRVVFDGDALMGVLPATSAVR